MYQHNLLEENSRVAENYPTINLIGKNVKHINNLGITMKIIRMHGEIATCLLPKENWFYVDIRILVNIQICHINNLIEVNET